MKIKIFENWKETPDNPVRSIRPHGRAFITLDTERHSPHKIITKMAGLTRGLRTQNTNLLVVLTDKDYKNSLIGTNEQIHSFVRDCLVDENYLSKIWGRRK